MLSALAQYGHSDSDSGPEEDAGGSSSSALSGMTSTSLVPKINPAPMVAVKEGVCVVDVIDPNAKEVMFNPKYEELFAPTVGPFNPNQTAQQRGAINSVTGLVEQAEFNKFQFENQRKTFHSYGHAEDPSTTQTGKVFDERYADADVESTSVFEKVPKRDWDKRKRVRNMDPTDIDGYTGPWGGYVDEVKVSKPDEETMKEMEEFLKKRKKYKKVQKEDVVVESSELHIDDPVDYQGRSFLHAPHDVGVNLRSDEPPDKCFLPKKLIHTWSGHSRQIQAIRWFPKTAHLLLSSGMEGKVKLWEVYGQRRLVRSYCGHNQACRDINFNNDGTEFLSCSYDRFVKLWDTETGKCKERFTTGKVPYCVKFNPDEDKQHMFLAGMGDKKIIQWDTRTAEIVQEYDRHLGAVNTINFFDENRRFCSTSDDKSMRIWEWEIPVDTKLIQDHSLHSMPTATMSPNKKWLACQSMDNKIMVFQLIDDKLRLHKRKQFKGHMVAGYACSIDFSPDMTYISCGDANGKINTWNWKTGRMAGRWQAHDGVSIAVLWHPHESSKMVTAGWDGAIKFWD